MTAKQLEIQRRYDLTSRIYESRYQEVQRGKYASVSAEIPSSNVILDLGCGTGMFFSELSNRAKLLVATDISIEMLRHANSRPQMALLFQSDASHLPLRCQSLDAVVSVTMLQNAPEPLKVISEIARVLKSGGVAAITSLRRKSSPDQILEWVRRADLRGVKVEEGVGGEDILCVARKSRTPP
jgi:ubiquinone/menaquinone biosynthesis C-methylase UbiE